MKMLKMKGKKWRKWKLILLQIVEKCFSLLIWIDLNLSILLHLNPNSLVISGQFYFILLFNKYHHYTFYTFNCNLEYFSLTLFTYGKKTFLAFCTKPNFWWKNLVDLPKTAFDILSKCCFRQYVSSQFCKVKS